MHDHDADRRFFRELARFRGSADRTAPDAALCGAQPPFVEGACDAQTLSREGLEAELSGPPSARQSRAAALLATGMSVREAAAVLGIHRGTIFRWRQANPEFTREQRRCSAEAAGELTDVARRLLVKATGYVERLMEEDGSRSDWAARILRNRRLWDLALATSEGGER